MRITDSKECVLLMLNDCSDVCLKHVGYNENTPVKKLSKDELHLLKNYNTMYIVCDFYSMSSCERIQNILDELDDLDITIYEELCTTNLNPVFYKNVYKDVKCITFIVDYDATDADICYLYSAPSRDAVNQLYIHNSLYEKYDFAYFSKGSYNMIRKFDKIEDCDIVEDADFFTI